jgi:hypothetical protein
VNSTRHAAVAALIAVGACKSADVVSTPAPANQPSPIVAPATAATTAVFLASTMSGLLLGCAVDGAITSDKAACLAGIRGGVVGDRYGRTFAVGETGKHQCRESSGKTSYVALPDVPLPETYDGTRIGHIDPMTEILVYPAARAKELVLAIEGDDGSIDPAAAAMVLRREVVRLTDDPDEQAVAARPRTIAHLRADLDGDGAADTVWGVEGRPDDRPPDDDYGVNGLFAQLSKTGFVALRVHIPEWQEPIAAIDLDGDGAAELIHQSHYAGGETTTVSRIADGALVRIGDCCCTEP